MLSRLFRYSDVPRRYRANFLHLYFDVAWFGILSGSAVSFLTVYAARLGASGLQVGLLVGASAIVNLFLAIPAGRWVEKREINRAVFWSSVFYRLGYALWIPLPWLFGAQGQIWALIGISLFMAVPLTPLGVGFNALFAEAVPTRYRAHVAGIRNVAMAVAYMGSSLVSGTILDRVAFPVGYQIVFGIGFFGAAMSSLHLYFVKPLPDEFPAIPIPPEADSAEEAESPRGIFASMRLDILQSSFRRVLLLLLLFHFAHYIANPIYPLYNVNVLQLSDNEIGIGTALYYLTVLLGSTQFHRAVHRLDHKRVTGWGMIGMALYPFLLGLSHAVWQFYLVSLIGGFTWAMAGGAYANYILENIPPDDRPSHLAWYNMALNAAVLTGSLLGTAVADWTSLTASLISIAVLRVAAGYAILRWG